MKKYLWAGILFCGLYFPATAQSILQQQSAAGLSATTAETEFNDPIVTKISPVESELTGYSNKGQLHYRTRIKKNKLHGSWISWYDNGLLCDSGTLVNGLPDGEWKIWYPSGQLRFVRNYKADHLNRIQQEIIRYNPKTYRYTLTGLYFKNKAEALEKMKGIYGFPSLPVNQVSVKLAGLVASNTGNLNIYNPVFEKALLHGSFINYKQDGSILDSGYVDNGLKQGLWIEADATTGTYSKGWYNRGNRVQQWKTYDQQGKLLRIEEYQLGKLSWKKEFKNQ